MPTQAAVEDATDELSAADDPNPAHILGNLTYTGAFWPAPLTLIDGTGTYDDGSDGRPFVMLLDHLTPTADLDGDGTTDAIAVLVDNSSGSGTFTLLAAVFDVFGAPRPTEPVMIGDRTSLRALTISDTTGDDAPTVLADMITQGADDPLCCASWNGRMTLGLEDGRLVEQDFTLISQISLADLDATAWRLVDLDGGEDPVPDDVTVTAVFSGNELSGSAGCNAYTATLDTPDARPNALAVTVYQHHRYAVRGRDHGRRGRLSEPPRPGRIMVVRQRPSGPDHRQR